MKKGSRKLLSLILVLTMLMTLTVGCGKNTDNSAKPAQEQNEKKMKVALILSGPANDQGWNAIALEGLKAAEKKYNLEVAYTENVNVADSEAAFTDYANQGYDLIIGHGFQYGEPAKRVGENFPKQYFMATEANSKGDNMSSYVMACEQGAYVMGVIAASMTKSGTIGAVGGIEQPSIVKSIEAYKLGAKSVKPDIKILDAYVDSFTDVTAGQAAANSMIDKGADVLYHSANQAGTGVINAAKAAGIYALGDSYDQNSIAPDTVISSTIYNMPQVILTAVKELKEGKFGDSVNNLGMNEGVVDIAPYHSFENKLPEDVKKLVADTVQKIKDGTIKVPIIEKSTKN